MIRPPRPHQILRRVNNQGGIQTVTLTAHLKRESISDTQWRAGEMTGRLGAVHTSSCMDGGRAARNSGFTSDTWLDVPAVLLDALAVSRAWR